MSEAAASPWWARAVHADRRPRLLARQRMRRALQDWFEAQGFVEVDTPCLQVSPGNEAHLHAFETRLEATDASALASLYLQTSPEFAAKKLLAAGEERLFTFAHVFRNREAGPLHQPEFTMLEWYRADAPLSKLMTDCEALVRAAVRAAGGDGLSRRDRTVDPFQPFERLSVAQAFRRYAGIDLLASVTADGETDLAMLAAGARAAGLRVAADDEWADVFSRVLTALIEPRLGLERPTILFDYPIVEAALARRSPADPRVAERFELYAAGVELANAFGELTDPLEQRRRFEAEMALARRVYGRDYPLDEDFLAALADMPPASGIALGFDRLVMLATGAARIEDVLWAPVQRP